MTAAPAAAPAAVRLRELTKLYGNTRAVDRLSLTIEPGSIVALLGPSGCGKTTTLRMIAGLVEPNSGEIYIDDRAITGVPVHRRNIGMLFQNYALFPHMTVAENVAFGLETRGVRRKAAGARVAEALSLVQLDGYGGRLPSQLSGGQQQRVALARALVVQPAMMLLDEPLGALDKGLRETMQGELRALQRRLGITTVMVTHDQSEALTMADRVAILRDGAIEQVGTPSEVYQRPASRFTASFLGAANFFRGRIERAEGGSVLVRAEDGSALSVPNSTPAARPLGAAVTIALRPESIVVEPAKSDRSPGASENDVNSIDAEIEQIVYHGFVSHLHLRQSGGNRIVAFRQNDTGALPVLMPGLRVRASWAARSNHFVRDEAPPR